MTMRCAICQRTMLNPPATTYNGQWVGPKCAIKQGLAPPPKHRGKVEPVQRDDKTMDLFEGEKQ